MALTSVSLFGISLHQVRMSDALEELRNWMLDDQPCRYVVTPNVDHVVKLQSDSRMLMAYQGASLVVADGWPLVAASRFLGRALPERVAGSDLVPALLQLGQAIDGFKVFLLGAAPGVGITAAERIRARWPGVNVCGTLSPPLGFEKDPTECAKIVEAINSVSPHLLVVGLGAPKQEIWLSSFASSLDARVAIAAGATIDFLAGEQRRAPVWVQRLRLEWLYRLASDPRRLAARYVKDAIVFPRLVVAAWLSSRSEQGRSA